MARNRNNVAIYCRLSREDDVLTESDLYTVKEYNDNGVSEFKAAFIKPNANLTTCTFEYITKEKDNTRKSKTNNNSEVGI